MRSRSEASRPSSRCTTTGCCVTGDSCLTDTCGPAGDQSRRAAATAWTTTPALARRRMRWRQRCALSNAGFPPAPVDSSQTWAGRRQDGSPVRPVGRTRQAGGCATCVGWCRRSPTSSPPRFTSENASSSLVSLPIGSATLHMDSTAVRFVACSAHRPTSCVSDSSEASWSRRRRICCWKHTGICRTARPASISTEHTSTTTAMRHIDTSSSRSCTKRVSGCTDRSRTGTFRPL